MTIRTITIIITKKIEIFRCTTHDVNIRVVTLNVVKCLIQEMLHLRKLRFSMTKHQPLLPFYTY
jgi:hypothetical protein